MRLISYDHEGAWKAAILAGDIVVDASDAARAAGFADGACRGSARSVIQVGTDGFRALDAAARTLAARGQGRELGTVRLGAPIPDPEKVLLIGLNYRDHAAEANQPIPSFPMVIPAYRNSLAGPTDPIPLPSGFNEQVDYEGELAFVIGRRCRNASEQEALSHVAGLMVINDVSARDLQLKTPQWAAGKMVDGFKPCGPALVSLDEIADVNALDVTTRLNGAIMQHSSTAQFIFSIERLVAAISAFATLEPGDIVATGTPPGVGFARRPQVFLRNGDVIEVEISGLGKIRNEVCDVAASAA